MDLSDLDSFDVPEIPADLAEPVDADLPDPYDGPDDVPEEVLFGAMGPVAAVRQAMTAAGVPTSGRHPFRVVLHGESGSGRSSLLNALVGHDVVPVGGASGAPQVHRARWGETHRASLTATGVGPDAQVAEFAFCTPSEALRPGLVLIEPPGAGHPYPPARLATRRCLAVADAVLHTARIDRLERYAGLASLPDADDPHRSIVVAVTMADLAADPRAVVDAHLDRVRGAVRWSSHLSVHAVAVRGSDPFGLPSVVSSINRLHAAQWLHRLRGDLENPLFGDPPLPASTLDDLRDRLDQAAEEIGGLPDARERSDRLFPPDPGVPDHDWSDDDWSDPGDVHPFGNRPAG